MRIRLYIDLANPDNMDDLTLEPFRDYQQLRSSCSWHSRCRLTVDPEAGDRFDHPFVLP